MATSRRRTNVAAHRRRTAARGSGAAATLIVLAAFGGATAASAAPVEIEVVGVAEAVSDDFDVVNPYVPPAHVEVGDRLPISLRFESDDLVEIACSVSPGERFCYGTPRWRLEIVFSNRSVVEDVGVLELQLLVGTPSFVLATQIAEPFVLELEDTSGQPTSPTTDPAALLESPFVEATQWGFFPGGASVTGAIAPAPEPAGAALMLAGSALLAAWRGLARTPAVRTYGPARDSDGAQIYTEVCASASLRSIHGNAPSSPSAAS